MKKLFEYKTFSSLSEQELLEMSNIGYKVTGIENVILLIGPNPNYHWRRIKISNIPNKFSGEDCFTLTVPDFKVIGKIDETFITPKVLEKIKNFVNINYQVICDYSDYKILTDEFIENLKKIE
jgi:hypothetical protein